MDNLMNLGFGGSLTPEDFFEDIDLLEDEYDTPPSERSKPQQQDQSALALEAIRQRNQALEREVQNTRIEAARQYGELKAQVEFLKSQGGEIKDPKAADEFVNIWGESNNKTNQGQQQKPQQQSQIPVENVVKQTISQMAQEQARIAAEEENLARRFAQEHPEIIQVGGGKEAYYEWEKLKSLRPDLPLETRYELMKREVVRRFESLPQGAKVKPTIPPSQNGNVHPEVSELIMGDRRSEKEKLYRKSKDTARRVAEFRKEQLRKLSV